MAETPSRAVHVSTGIDGLDEILYGGLPERRIYIVRGGPGSGKTTLGMQFLREGVRKGEKALYVTLLQTREEVESVVTSHGWSLDGIEVLELPEDIKDAATMEQTIFRTSDVELHEATDAILEAIDKFEPDRVMLDSIDELAVLVENRHQLRRHLVRLKRKLEKVQCTSIVSLGSVEQEVTSLQTIVHGVMNLSVETPPYGEPRRRLEIGKMRGMTFVGGYHDFRITTGGIVLYPRMEVSHAQPDERLERTTVPSGNKQLDQLLGGGLVEGSACLITGTSGAGKSTLTSLYAQAAAERGERSAIFCFDERRETFLRRSEGLGMNVGRYVDEGLIDLRQYDVGKILPDEFMQTVCHAVDVDHAKVVVIDSITGYINAMPNERALMLQLHKLLSYLGDRGVLTLLVVSAQGAFGASQPTIDTSYLADTVIMMRHFEARGKMSRCIAALKKRHGPHESAIREIQMGQGGMRIGPPLTQFSGVLTGTPKFEGPRESLLEHGGEPEA